MQRETSGKEKFTQKLSAAIHKSRYVLIASLSVLVILVVTWVIVSEVRSRRAESSAVLVEAASEKFDEWRQEEDEERAAALGEELVSDLERIIDDYPRMYAGHRALFILGSYYFHSGEWEPAADSFLSVAEKTQDNYLGPVSAINAAVAMEEAGNYDDAIGLYEDVIEDYGESSPEIARVLFSLGRLHETHGTREAALDFYNRLVDDYASSSWTNLAQDRIIYLNLD